jgi:hypothetical protein
MHRARGILNINKKKTDSVVSKAKSMDAGIGAHPAIFVSPNPPLSVIQNQVVVVDKAQILASTGAKGTAKARNVQRGILVGMLEAEVTYVQGVADSSPTPEQAAATIEAAGLTVALIAQRTKAILTVSQGPTPGSVHLDACARLLLGKYRTRKTFFNWQYTADGGLTFITLSSTPKSKTTLANLTPLHTYGFQVSITNPDGIAEAWSQVVTFLVH